MDSIPQSQSEFPSSVVTVISAILLPIGALLLFSFGAQIVFGPFVLAIEWILARVSPRPLRLAWSVLAGLLAGEIAYLVVDVTMPSVEGRGGSIIAGVLAAVLVAGLFATTTNPDR
ncbi:hypothetical protein BH23ACT6_BH23ACT6_28000 [soil metagenome]